MKRAVSIVVSSLALAGLLIADVAWPKASTAQEAPAVAPAAQANATPEAAAQSMPGSVEDASNQLDEPAAAVSASGSEASADENGSKATSLHNDVPAADASDVR